LLALNRTLGTARGHDRGDVEIILQRGLEEYPDAKARFISDNGPQFIARDSQEFIRIAGLKSILLLLEARYAAVN
jgi:transposase InsO family protein